MTFEALKIDQKIMDAIDKLGYKNPTEVQALVIPKILAGKDILVKAKTGSGKTASFAIPLIEKIIWEENKPQALILSPTRELALQIKEDFDNIGAYKRIKTVAVFGKQPYRFQIQDLKQKCHSVIGTPGRVLDHLERDTLDVSKLQFLIIDEADEMLNMGFIDDVKRIIERLPKQRVTCLFSATLPPVIEELTKDFMKHPEAIEIAQEEVVNEQIDTFAYRVKEHEKKDFLLKLLVKEMPSSAIIFAKTQEHVNDVCDFLFHKNLSVDKIHGGMLQEDRLENMNDFRLGKIQFLVATDVASRGIDVDRISLVVNYDLPEEKERFVHRIGRTGRIGKKGKAISFLSEYDDHRQADIEEYVKRKMNIEDRKLVDRIEYVEADLRALHAKKEQKENKNREIKKDIMRLYLNGGKKKKIRAGDIVGAICEIHGIDSEDIGVIQVQDMGSYVDILHNKGNIVLKQLQQKTIKGKKLRVEISKSSS